MSDPVTSPGEGADQQVGPPPPGVAAATPVVVRSEERARVAFPVRVSGRVRLVKQIEVEEVTRTFTVRREVLRVVEEPADPDGALAWDQPLPEAADGRGFEIVLHAEQVVTTTVVVPYERVRVGTRLVETDVEVSADLRREHVEVDERPAG